jgi:zinc/manganese transport system ATP-binding protein
MVSHAFDGLPERPIRILVMNGGSITLDTVCQPNEVEGLVRRNSAVTVHA